MMTTDRGLDAGTRPPINALNQTTRHPQSLPRRQRRWGAPDPNAIFPGGYAPDALDAAESERAALVGER
jgi:hypothetical protein